jgi:hypothetical protein
MRRFAVETISSPAFKQKAKTCRNVQPNPSRARTKCPHGNDGSNSGPRDPHRITRRTDT